MLLLGPTGSGKTPIGNMLADQSRKKPRCHHFDFGHHLRLSASSESGHGPLTSIERGIVRRVLADGSLLEDGQFGIAMKILNGFLANSGFQRNDVLVLNGLPRHIGQAGMLANIVNIRLVIALESDDLSTYARVAGNSWGDRAGRTDDSREEIARKLAVFARKTKPLVEFYGQRGVRIETIEVNTKTATEDVLSTIERLLSESFPDSDERSIK